MHVFGHGMFQQTIRSLTNVCCDYGILFLDIYLSHQECGFGTLTLRKLCNLYLKPRTQRKHRGPNHYIQNAPQQ